MRANSDSDGSSSASAMRDVSHFVVAVYVNVDKPVPNMGATDLRAVAAADADDGAGGVTLECSKELFGLNNEFCCCCCCC